MNSNDQEDKKKSLLKDISSSSGAYMDVRDEKQIKRDEQIVDSQNAPQKIINILDAQKEDFSVSSRYLENLNVSFKFSLRVAASIITIGIVLIIIGQSFREIETIGIMFSILPMIGLILAFTGFLFLIRDVQLSSVAKIKYKVSVNSRGIYLFQEGINADQPLSFFPFNAFIEARIVPVTPFIKKNLMLNLSALKFSKLARNLSVVLVKFNVDQHLKGKVQKQIFFEIPAGYTLFFIEDSDRFLKTVKKKRIKRKT
ncbi:MAG: hypothetical protein ACXACX_10990 [Candidatus Hodarchaeales archaeon]|jgi:hypothetical protein